MELPAPATPSSNRSSVLRFFRSLVGGKSSHQDPDQALVLGRGREQDVIPLMGMEDASGPGREELVLQAKMSHALHLPGPKGSHHQMDIAGLGMGDSGVHVPSELQEDGFEGPGGKLALVAGQTLPIDQLEKEEEEEAGEASGDIRIVGRDHFAQAICGEDESLPMAMGSLEISPEAFTAEEEKECLLQKDLRLGSAKTEGTPWNRLLNMYKQLRKPVTAKESLTHQENEDDVEVVEEEGEKEEDGSFSLNVHGFATIQSPLHKTFKSTDTVGFVENELKKLLAVQRESRLWKTGGQEGRELLIQPEVTLEEAGIVDGQHLLLEEMDEMGNWPPD